MRHQFFDAMYTTASRRDAPLPLELYTTRQLWPGEPLVVQIRRACLLHELYLTTQQNLIRAVTRTNMLCSGKL